MGSLCGKQENNKFGIKDYSESIGGANQTTYLMNHPKFQEIREVHQMSDFYENVMDDPIGSGFQASVFKVRRKKCSNIFAMKTIDKN